MTSFRYKILEYKTSDNLLPRSHYMEDIAGVNDN
jgi:hypothetical protein